MLSLAVPMAILSYELSKELKNRKIILIIAKGTTMQATFFIELNPIKFDINIPIIK